LRIEPGYLAGF